MKIAFEASGREGKADAEQLTASPG